MIFTSRQSKAADPLPVNVVVAFPAEEFVGVDLGRDLMEDADGTGDEIAATFVRVAEPPVLVEAVATFVMDAGLPALVEAVAGLILGCAVLTIPARLSVTPTLSQFCVAKLMTSERFQRRTVSVKSTTYLEYLLESNPFRWQE